MVPAASTAPAVPAVPVLPAISAAAAMHAAAQALIGEHDFSAFRSVECQSKTTVRRVERIEVRRLMAWFNEKFFEEASNPLVTERIYKRFMSEDDGGGAPTAEVMRAAKANVRYHLAYIGWLARTRNFLAGDQLTYADLAAAAHLSAIDYLGDVPWIEDDAAKAWYARVKSRPSFRPLLSEWLAGVPASRTYVDLDF